jgi:Ca2+/Na+ antiporter
MKEAHDATINVKSILVRTIQHVKRTILLNTYIYFGVLGLFNYNLKTGTASCWVYISTLLIVIVYMYLVILGIRKEVELVEYRSTQLYKRILFYTRNHGQQLGR